MELFKMEKKDIKIVQRHPSFYFDDLKKIRKKVEGWENLKILHDLVGYQDFAGDEQENMEVQGVLICENTKTNKLEVLEY